MPNLTIYKQLVKPLSNEKYDINVFNGNADIIDESLHNLEEKNQEQDNALATKESLNEHVNNKQNPHEMTKSQIGLNNVENKSSEQIRNEITDVNIYNALGYTPCSPTDVDNKLSAFENDIDWKEAVDTYNDILTTYPEPEDGWTVNTKDTDYTYRFNGNKWILTSANAIPIATNDVDGKLSKEDHAKYDSLVGQMLALQQKDTALDTRVSALEQGGGGSGFSVNMYDEIIDVDWSLSNTTISMKQTCLTIPSEVYSNHNNLTISIVLERGESAIIFDISRIGKDSYSTVTYPTYISNKNTSDPISSSFIQIKGEVIDGKLQLTLFSTSVITFPTSAMAKYITGVKLRVQGLVFKGGD